MPNYVYNTIRFKKEDKEKFSQYLKQGNFDFNKRWQEVSFFYKWEMNCIST